MGGCSSRGSYHRMEARLSLDGTATSDIRRGQNVTASGGCGETEVRETSHGQEKDTIHYVKEQRIYSVGETVPSQSTEGLTL